MPAMDDQPCASSKRRDGLAPKVLDDVLQRWRQFALEDQHEIVPTHMAHEVAPRIAVHGGQARHQADHLVAAPVAVVVVEGLEVVQVRIAGHELGAVVQQALDVQADGDVAGQKVSGLAWRAASMRVSVTARTSWSPVPRPGSGRCR